MKKLLVFGLVFCAVCFVGNRPAGADEYASVKQGFVVKWHNPELSENQGLVDNLSVVTIAKTRPVDGLGRWNALVDGWTLDAGVAYDAAEFNTVALLLGRDFGTIGKYFPIDFPLKDKIQMSIYPIGIVVEDVTDDFEIHAASGVGILKFDIAF